MADDMHRQQMGAALDSYALAPSAQSDYWQKRRAEGSALAQQMLGGNPFRQELDELVRSIVIDKNRARDLPAFENACMALGYIYDKDECALYREEIVRVEPKTERVKVL